MSIQYDLRENPFKKEDGKAVLYPGVVVKSLKDSEYLIEHIARHTAFSRGVVTGVLKELTGEIVSLLQEGHNVRIDDLGTFSLSLSARDVTDRKEIRSPSIRVEKVNFRPATDLAKRVSRGASIERVEYGGFQTSSREHTSEERWAWLMEYLQEHGSITRVQYAKQMGLAPSSAARELTKWVGEKKLAREGKHSHTVYVLSQML